MSHSELGNPRRDLTGCGTV